MVPALIERGYRVTALDINKNTISLFRDGSARIEDCRDFFRYNRTTFDLVVHLAAIVGGREMIEGQPLSVATDLSIDAELFNWAVKTEQPRVIYYSSSAAYPVNLQSGLTEQRMLEDFIDLESAVFGVPDMTYGWSKLSGELLAQHVMMTTDTRVHVFRPFSGYGEDQSTDYPFMAMVDRFIRRDDPFIFWGDGTQVRDWIHIDDVIEGTFAFVDADDVRPVNLCSGRPTSFIQLKTLMNLRMPEYTPRARFAHQHPVGVLYRVGHPGRMLERFTPKITLETGIERAFTARERQA